MRITPTPLSGKRIKGEGQKGFMRSSTPKLIHVVGARPNFMKAAPVIAAIADRGRFEQFLGTPCLTLRENTERPVTMETGTNILGGQDMEALLFESGKILDGRTRKGGIPPLWDGRSAKRIADVLERFFL